MNVHKIYTENIINALKNEPALWQRDSESYKKKIERDKAWERLLVVHQDFEPHATVDSVKRKVNALRASHRRELIKVKNSLKSAASPKDIYVPTLWYFKLLDFVHTQVNQTEDNESLDDPLDIEEVIKPEKPRAPKRKKRVEEEFLEKEVHHLEREVNQLEREVNIVEKSETPTTTENDEAAVFANGWAVQYRKLNGNQKLFAKRLIDDALFQGQLRLLSFNSTINNHQQQQFVAVQHSKDSRYRNSSPYSSTEYTASPPQTKHCPDMDENEVYT